MNKVYEIIVNICKVIFIVVTYAQFDSNIRVLYVFGGFFKNTAQNMQSGKGYVKNHYWAAKTAVC